LPSQRPTGAHQSLDPAAQDTGIRPTCEIMRDVISSPGALKGSPGAGACYDALRSRRIGHQAALTQLANRLVGILHGCLKTDTLYNETTACAHHNIAAA
jgi:hypothetical protein